MYSFKWITTSRITCAHAARARAREREICCEWVCVLLTNVEDCVMSINLFSLLYFVHFYLSISLVLWDIVNLSFSIGWKPWMERVGWRKKMCVSWYTITIITAAAATIESQVNCVTLNSTKLFTKCKEISSSQHMYCALSFSKLI